jgi:hypothetical protein
VAEAKEDAKEDVDIPEGEAVVVDDEDDAEKEIDPNDIDDKEDDDMTGEMDEDDDEDENGNEPQQPMTLEDAQEQGSLLEAELAAAVASIEQLEQRKRPAAKSFLRKEPPSRALRQGSAQPSPAPTATTTTTKSKRASSRNSAPLPASAVLGDDVNDALLEPSINRRGTPRRSASMSPASKTSGKAKASPKKKTTKAAATKTPKNKNNTTSSSSKKQPSKQPAAKAASTVSKTRGTPTRRPAKSPSSAGGGGSGRKRSPLVSEGRPDDAYPGDGDWPSGWKKRVYERQTGASKGQLDSYWYTPKLQVKLRSMAEIRRWLAAMEKTKGDEEAARQIYKSIVL